MQGGVMQAFSLHLADDEGSSRASAKLTIQDVWTTVEETLQVPHDAIDGVQQRSAKRWDVTLQPHAFEIYKRIRDEQMGSEIRINTGKSVTISNPYEIITGVTVRKVPMYWSKQRVLQIFSKYGTVKSIKKERYRTADANGTTFEGLWNGNLYIQMILKERIPSGITIADTNIEIYYRSQEPTCRTCGLMGHKFYECRTPKTQRTNIFNLDDFPNLTQRQPPQDEIPEENTAQNTSGNDIDN